MNRIEQFQHLPALPLGTGDDMTAAQFRRSFGVPVSSLPHVRQSLSMERDARREVYGDNWRDAFAEIADEFNGDDDDDASDPLTLDGGDLIAEAKGWRSSRLTCELVDGFED